MARDGKQIGVVLKQQDYEELANIARSKDISISALVRSIIIEHFHLPSNVRHPISSGAAKNTG